MSNVWTEERVEKLRAWWAEGRSAGQVEALFGGVMSRNAIIGKVHRLGLERRRYGVDPKMAKLRREARRRAASNNQLFPPPPPSAKGFSFGRNPHQCPVMEPSSIIEVEDVPPSQRKALVNLEPEDCRWPIGDPLHEDFGFCGARAVDGAQAPYCAHHLMRAFTPLPSAKRKTTNDEVKAKVEKKELANV